jgi:hypothetical protein
MEPPGVSEKMYMVARRSVGALRATVFRMIGKEQDVQTGSLDKDSSTPKKSKSLVRGNNSVATVGGRGVRAWPALVPARCPPGARRQDCLVLITL